MTAAPAIGIPMNDYVLVLVSAALRSPDLVESRCAGQRASGRPGEVDRLRRPLGGPGAVRVAEMDTAEQTGMFGPVCRCKDDRHLRGGQSLRAVTQLHRLVGARGGT